MSSILDKNWDADYDLEEPKRYSLESVKKLALDNWLDSGYTLLVPEKDFWNSDNY